MLDLLEEEGQDKDQDQDQTKTGEDNRVAQIGSPLGKIQYERLPRTPSAASEELISP